ncbi:MAG TPA: hypothetical protein VJJ26_02050 [Candidatus Babeliales bacterium]|nr:hypothetical protein [Candidatus Babeliales bacterium]
MKVLTKRLLLFSTIIFSVAAIQVSKNIFAAQATRNVVSRQVQVKTSQEALVHIRKIIANVPKDTPALQAYEREQSDLLSKCAKVLYDSARTQILEALLEIDNRITYWQYQRDHQWKYFVSKSPFKWVMGPKQEEEIENNLDLLKSHQGELYVLLGQLSELGNLFTQGYKDIFLTDYTKGYEWIDKLLDVLPRIKTDVKAAGGSSPFVARVNALKAKLEKVGQFKNDLLADITETVIPSHYARNWLKYGALMFALNYGYNRGLIGQLSSSFNFATTNINEYFISPVKAIGEDIFYPGQISKVDSTTIVPAAAGTHDAVLELTKNFVRDNSATYGIGEDQANEIAMGLDKGDYSGYLKFLEVVKNKEQLYPHRVLSYFSGLGEYGKGIVLFAQLFGAQSLDDIQRFVLNFISAQQKQYAAVGKLVLLTPAIFTGWLAYSGYQKLTAPVFGPIRRALVDVNSLFVDQSKQLTDEQYGKMIYLLYNLKKRAEKELTQKNNIRADFIHDLERIESKEFNVAAKRAIVEDMFKKYSFLGIIQKK